MSVTVAVVKRDGSKHEVLFSSSRAHIAQGHKWHISHGYAITHEYIKGKDIKKRANRLVLEEIEREAGRVLEPWQAAEHKNRNSLDNRDENLRVATMRQNMWNREVFDKSKTGFKGVFFCEKTGDYLIHITSYGKNLCGSRTKSIIEARKTAVCINRIVQDDDFQCLDFPDVSFEKLWCDIGIRQRNQIRHSLKLVGFWEGKRKEMTGELEDMSSSSGVYLDKRTQRYRCAIKFNGLWVTGKCTKDKIEAYKAYDCILWKLKIKNRIKKFPSISPENKWEQIGEGQRQQIEKGVRRCL
jgi:hypothetical protein